MVVSNYASTNSVALASWDYVELQARAGEAQGQQPRGSQPDLQDYDGAGAYRFKDEAHALVNAENHLAAHAARSRQLIARGAVRSLRVGQAFVVIDHPSSPAHNLHVIAIEHSGVNNLKANIGSSEDDTGSYRTQLRLLPSDIAFVALSPAKPSALPQGAQVVGLDDNPLHSDREHRIKVQFPWQRGNSPNNGGIAHASSQDNAPGNASAFTWVRLAEWLAGPNYGSSFTPRIGDEVLIDFIENDIDRPLIVGSLYGEQDIPPYSAGEEASSNHAGAISGFHSQNLSGDGHSRWANDDSAGQLRTQLQSTAHGSAVTLGHTIRQGELHAIASHNLSLTAGGTASVFTHHGGLTLIAANETVTIGAHTDALQLVSEQGLTITSTESEIQVLAQDSVTLFGGGAAVELKGANITCKASGTFTVKAASTAFSGGGGAGAEIAKLPDTQVKFFDEAFVLKNKATGAPLANQAYRVKRPDGTIETGVTDDQGHTHLVKSSEAGSIQLELIKNKGEPTPDVGEVVDNDAATQLAGPGGSNKRKSDPVAWFITPYGKSKNLVFANLAAGNDKFYTVGIHSQINNELKITGQQIEFLEENSNCFAYALGVRDRGMISFSSLHEKEVFNAALVRPVLARVKGRIGINSNDVLPFNTKVESGFIALDMWQSTDFKKEYMWHVTRRIQAGGKTIIVSKDGSVKPVQNFTPEQVSSGFTTNVASYRGIPAYTMLIPLSSCENWAELHQFLSGSR